MDYLHVLADNPWYNYYLDVHSNTMTTKSGHITYLCMNESELAVVESKSIWYFYVNFSTKRHACPAAYSSALNSIQFELMAITAVG